MNEEYIENVTRKYLRLLSITRGKENKAKERKSKKNQLKIKQDS